MACLFLLPFLVKCWKASSRAIYPSSSTDRIRSSPSYGEPDFTPPKVPSSATSDESNNETLPDCTLWYNSSCRVAPGHYIRYLVNRIGEPPTPHQLLLAVKTMRKYIQVPIEVKLGFEIDEANRKTKSTMEQIRAGLHYFFCTSSSSRKRRESHITSLKAFCDAVESRLSQVPDDMRHKPDVRAPSYVGYAAYLETCFQEHGTGTTSFLMSLLGNVFKYLKFEHTWDDFITNYAVNAEEAQLGECIINGLSQGYCESGFGVAVALAGCKSRPTHNNTVY
jgi:hypothetical protein